MGGGEGRDGSLGGFCNGLEKRGKETLDVGETLKRQFGSWLDLEGEANG